MSKTNDQIKIIRLNQSGVKISLGTTDIDLGRNEFTIASLLLFELVFIEDHPQ